MEIGNVFQTKDEFRCDGIRIHRLAMSSANAKMHRVTKGNTIRIIWSPALSSSVGSEVVETISFNDPFAESSTTSDHSQMDIVAHNVTNGTVRT